MGFVAADRADDRGVEMKKIAKILFWSVLFVWMIFLQPQNVMAAEADEIIKELDFTDINAQTQDLPEKMDFEKMVNKLVTEEQADWMRE